jgi:hypothetical protein
MEQKKDGLLMTGLFWFTLSVIIIVNTWLRFGTLTAEFLLGALAAWGIACGMHKFENSDKMDDE